MKKLFSSMLLVTTIASAALAEVKPDNSAVNDRDRKQSEVTADSQTTNPADTEITRRIRQEIMKESDLSTYAQNIKIITINGKVTLKGPVRTRSEERRILNYAQGAVGKSNVINEMAISTVKTN